MSAQGNGVERDKLHFEDSNLCVVDLYNRYACKSAFLRTLHSLKLSLSCCSDLWPGDATARKAIDVEQRFR